MIFKPLGEGWVIFTKFYQGNWIFFYRENVFLVCLYTYVMTWSEERNFGSSLLIQRFAGLIPHVIRLLLKD
jgi:hypothetical protein